MNTNYLVDVHQRPLWSDVNTFEKIGWVQKGDTLIVLEAENCLPELRNNSRLKVMTQDCEIGWVRRGDYKKIESKNVFPGRKNCSY